MIRELVIAAALTGAAISAAPAAAGNPRYDGDVPGINYNAELGAPCDSYERYVFGRGPEGGEALACHEIPNQFFVPPAPNAYWVISYPLYGVQQVGAPCPGPQSAAQSPDGLEMLCLGKQGWQLGRLIGGGYPLTGGGFVPITD